MKATDRQGRKVAGVNTSMSGGFEAHYRTSDGSRGEICIPVTEDGHCWIEGRLCTIGEAYFGGVVIEACDPVRP